MRRDSLRFGRGFRISIGYGRAQATQMAIPPCGPEGGATTASRARIDGCSWRGSWPSHRQRQALSLARRFAYPERAWRPA
jgi:hypothetical protein